MSVTVLKDSLPEMLCFNSLDRMMKPSSEIEMLSASLGAKAAAIVVMVRGLFRWQTASGCLAG